MNIDETELFIDGMKAYCSGKLRTSNPYSDDTKEFQEYDDRWLWAKQVDNGEKND